MNSKEILNIVRLLVFDTKGVMWSDDELLNFIDYARKKYCEDTCCFTKTWNIRHTNGVYQFPNDYIKLLAIYSVKELPVVQVSSKDLFYRYGDFLTLTGYPEFIYNDLVNNKSFSLCPNPVDLQNITITIFEGYGVLDDGVYGVVDNDDYGVEESYIYFEDIAEMIYSYYGLLDEIKDYMAIVYYACYHAFQLDTDFKDLNKADFFKARYQERIFYFQRAKRVNSGKLKTGKFY